MSLPFLARAGSAIRIWWGRRRPRKSFPPPLAFLTDPAMNSLAVLETLPPGMLVVLRDYERPDRSAWALALAGVAKRKRLALLVAGDFRLAAKVGAAGLHLPEGMARSGRLGPALGWLRHGGGYLTHSAHSPAALRHAKRIGADAAFLGPAFPTLSHRGRKGLGPLRLRAMAGQAGLPTIALGGIDNVKARALLSPRCQALACLAAIRLFDPLA